MSAAERASGERSDPRAVGGVVAYHGPALFRRYEVGSPAPERAAMTDIDHTNAFPYPGSKSMLAPWIVSKFPAHHTYAEPFGGSAAVLVRKPPSDVEVFNDIDEDVVHFFRTLKESHDELVQWLRATPFSREEHRRYADQFVRGYRPVDDIERAGRFYYLRYTQFAQKYTEVSGFRLSREKNHAGEFQNAVDELHAFRDRLNRVMIENLDYEELVDRLDAPDTMFYFDPPYVGAGDDLYSHGEFDHQRFVNVLESIEGRWVVSYTELPEGLESGYHVVAQEKRGTMRTGQGDWEQTNTERLVMNYDPQQAPSFSEAGQITLPEVDDTAVVPDGGGSP